MTDPAMQKVAATHLARKADIELRAKAARGCSEENLRIANETFVKAAEAEAAAEAAADAVDAAVKILPRLPPSRKQPAMRPRKLPARWIRWSLPPRLMRHQLARLKTHRWRRLPGTAPASVPPRRPPSLLPLKVGTPISAINLCDTPSPARGCCCASAVRLAKTYCGYLGHFFL